MEMTILSMALIAITLAYALMIVRHHRTMAKLEMARSKIAQAYIVIGHMLTDPDSIEDVDGYEALDYFCEDERNYDEDFLPWPKLEYED